MKNFLHHRSQRGQTALEYLLLLAIVAIVVVSAFGRGSLIDQIQNTAGGYYNTVTQVIMGKNPKAINGGWCSVSCPPSGATGPTTLYSSCECPPPAFGGAYCSGTGQVTCQGVINCGPCPTGQTCNSKGTCSCPNGLTCNDQSGSPTGSIPDSTCSNCICPSGTTYNQAQNACTNNCTQACTSWSSSTNSCQPVNCDATFSPNSYCDPTQPAATECQCDSYAIFNGTACVPCMANGNSCTSPNAKHTACVNINCQALYGYSYCDTTTNSCGCDESPQNNFCTIWNGSSCVQSKCGCTPNPACPTQNGCGHDNCGNICGSKKDGSCPGNETCNYANGTSGTCS